MVILFCSIIKINILYIFMANLDLFPLKIMSYHEQLNLPRRNVDEVKQAQLVVIGQLMSEFETQDLEYDNTDLGQTSRQFNLTAPRLIETLSALVTRIEAKQSYPKDDMRKLWVKKSTEREKL